jgi:hypothetical protein
MRVLFVTSILALLAETASAALVSLKEINPPVTDTNRIVAIAGAKLIDGMGGAPPSNERVMLNGRRLTPATPGKSTPIP